MTETLVAVTPSKNAVEKTAAAVIEVPDAREVDELEVAGSWCARPVRPGWR